MEPIITFTVGEQVKCVIVSPLKGNYVAPPLTLDQTYPIQSIILDSKGNQHINVGLESKLNYIRSFETKEELPDGDKIHWCHPSRFVKV